jgi:uncharacterized membrane protein YeaQ/YmgE (transglycosylase-associated protein family)
MVNILLWALAGGTAGWIGFSLVGFNEDRGLAVSVVIGMVGGFLGGNMLAPMFSAGAVNPGVFNPFSLFIAFACAAAVLTVSNMVYKRFGF